MKILKRLVTQYTNNMNRERLIGIGIGYVGSSRIVLRIPDSTPVLMSDYLFGLDWPSLSLGPFDIRSEWTHIYIKINL